MSDIFITLKEVGRINISKLVRYKPIDGDYNNKSHIFLLDHKWGLDVRETVEQIDELIKIAKGEEVELLWSLKPAQVSQLAKAISGLN